MSGPAPAGAPALIGGGSLEPPPHLRPHPGAAAVFERRAARFAALAPGHPAGDYLHLLARLAAAQAAVARRLPPAAGPAAPATSPAGGPGAPDAPAPLDPERPWPAGWREALAGILAGLRGEAAPEVRAALAALEGMAAAPLEALAGRVLCGRATGEEVALAPFVGAALQVAWTAAAAALPPAAVARRASGCPRCGGPPVAGLLLGDDRLRYLVCALCATEWHHTRAQCVLCHGSGALDYRSVEGDPGPARAEACRACRAWLKLLDVERTPRLEPVADDVASLRLDLLMAEEGLSRLGWSLYLAPGE